MLTSGIIVHSRSRNDNGNGLAIVIPPKKWITPFPTIPIFTPPPTPTPTLTPSLTPTSSPSPTPIPSPTPSPVPLEEKIEKSDNTRIALILFLSITVGGYLLIKGRPKS